MKLLNKGSVINIILLVLLFLPCNIHAESRQRRTNFPPPHGRIELIYEFFANNPSRLYYVGVRQFYLGYGRFSRIMVDGQIEDHYTSLMFIIPFGGQEGLLIQARLLEGELFDAFRFKYDPTEFDPIYAPQPHDFFEQKDIPIDYFGGYTILRELGSIRFQLRTLDELNISLNRIGINIE